MIAELGNCRFEILREGERFRGLGRCWIGNTLVRSGRLPLTVHTETFLGAGLAELRLLEVRRTAAEVRIGLAGIFQPLETMKMRDHSFDPIHDTGDWDRPRAVGECRLDLVIRPARDNFHGIAFRGFSYHWEYQSRDIAIYYLMDKASWEMDGDITGVTVYNQSSCSAPEAVFAADTFWTTEGVLFFLDPASCFNRCMTHNLPRWASHQAFDFQFRGDRTLIGVFDRVDLIRTVLRRDPGKPELKCFDKHIFDETKRYATSAKAILLNTDAKSATAQKNLWTWILDEVHDRARKEFGLRAQPCIPMMGHHYWVNRTIDTYYKDIVPACAAVGIRAIFLENFRRSDASEPTRLPNGNMCGPHDLEISDYTGGLAKFKEYISRCQRLGIKNYMWTAIHFSLASPINRDHRAGTEKCWFMAMEDTRTKYGGAYTNVLSNLDMRNPEARRYWVDGHRRLVKESGLAGYFIDSFYNLFFMPIDYKTGHPRTVWRQGLTALSELQKCGVGWY
ncbi:MAG: putative glycoside hydrolase family 15 protein, partial [Planctomycetota bacterium]|nr:putative glycoside hydrolase family 15 protein [Planctomycetota bacterium]